MCWGVMYRCVKGGLAIGAVKKENGRYDWRGNGFTEMQYMIYVFGLLNKLKTRICVDTECVNVKCEKVFSVCSSGT